MDSDTTVNPTENTNQNPETEPTQAPETELTQPPESEPTQTPEAEPTQTPEPPQKKKKTPEKPDDNIPTFKVTPSESRIITLRRTAKETRTYRVQMRVLSLLLVLLLILTGVVYGVAALYKKTGSFTVSIDKYEMTKYGLTLSENRNMTHNNSHLNAKICEEMTNIAGETIPDNVDMIDGEHNGLNHIAYTFYLQNAGGVEVAYDYQLNVSNITQALDEAIRVRLYVDGNPTTYAKTRSDGKGAEPGTTEFYSASIIAKDRVDSFAPGEITKFTVVIWIEGNDPDCIDWLIGGELKVDMLMSIVH